MIRHVVAWNMVGESPERRLANAKTAREAIETLPILVPQILRLETGLDLAEKPDHADLVLIVDVASRENLDAYAAHPEHRKVADLIGTLTTQRTVVDYEV